MDRINEESNYAHKHNSNISFKVCNSLMKKIIVINIIGKNF